MYVVVPFDFGVSSRARRHQLKLGQADVARVAGVGRQWLVDFEAGKASVELGLALRTLHVLGLELSLSATMPPPPWTRPLTRAAVNRTRPYSNPRRAKRRPAPTPETDETGLRADEPRQEPFF
jgi:HTH-type transcriptional regulator/antitoxin HipB